MMHLAKDLVCKGCNGSKLQIQDEGPLKGMLRMCPICSGSWKQASNYYGTDMAEHTSTYVDLTKGILQKIDKKKDYILTPSGETIILNQEANG